MAEEQKKKVPVKILIIEPDAHELERLRKLLSEANGASFELVCVGRLSERLSRLAEETVEVMLSDLHLPDSSGIEMIQRLHAKAPHIPIVALAAKSDERVIKNIVREGAQDYLFKDRVDGPSLAKTILYVVEVKRAERALAKAQEDTEVLLSSIPSILIGLNAEGKISYWNGNAEKAFQVRATDALNQSLEECDIRWELARIKEGIQTCRAKDALVRVDDVPYICADGAQGFLGFTVIPIKGNLRDRFGFLLFGVDITERKNLEQMKDEFVSTVSHELRTPLTVIREGVSQVLEGILGETTENQKLFLSVSLQAIDRLARIINDLLDISKIEAHKIELKLNLIDLCGIVQHLAAPATPFQLRAQEKNLILQTHLPEKRAVLYADRDKLIQIFTNLIGNAMKFTENGSIEITVMDHEDSVECRISDTGKGIAPEDLPRVFTKFMQFSRTHGPGDKGTGLGLAISKALVELHHGKISVESVQGRGTTFFFSLPKLKTEDVWKHHITAGLRKAQERGRSMSVVVFMVTNWRELEQQIGVEKVMDLLEELERCVKQSLRYQADIVTRSQSGVLIVLSSTSKDEAMCVAERIEREYREKWGKASGEHGLKLEFRVSGFPDDSATLDDLLRRLFPR